MKLVELQEMIRKFTEEKNMNAQVEIRIIDIASEVGELSKEVLKGTNYGCKGFEPTKDWKCEIGDVLFSLICIANETGIDLQDSLMTVLDKYEKRFNQKGHLGSEE